MSSCPAEHELAALAHGERASEEIESHVRVCAACQQHLSDVQTALTHLRVAVSRSHAPAAPTPALAPSLRPSFVGKYFIAGTLAEHSDRAVYRGAHHLLDQEVVLSLARERWTADVATRATVAAESRKLLALRHEAVAKVLDYDLVDDRPYTIEEFVRGPGLDRIVESRKVDWIDAVNWIGRLAAGAAAVRAAGLDLPQLDAQHARLNDKNSPQLVGLAEAWLVNRVLPLIADSNGITAQPTKAGSTTASSATGDDVRQLAQLFGELIRLPAGPVTITSQALETAGVSRRIAAALARALAPASDGGAKSAAELAEQLERLASAQSWLRRLFG
ncbi:MAG: hypothetical protein K2Y37_00220 [Pirellulales bacterium]|nr:hypothetical protein [Pirellulales bacterium]